MHNTQEQNPQQKDEKQVRSVFVGNIPYEATDEELKNIFSKIGPVLSFRIVYDRETGKPKGYGFCEYRDIETAQSAIRNLNGLELHSRTLRVDSAVNEKGKEEQKEAKLQEIPTCGPVVSSESASENIGKFMASMPPEQAFELLQQTKICIHNNPDESREMLIRNPQLGFALLQALILLKLVDPKMIDQLILKQPKLDAPSSPILVGKDFAPREVRMQNDADKLAVPKTLPGDVVHRMAPLERVHDYAHQKSHRQDLPHDYKYSRPPFNSDFKKPQKIASQVIDDYYEKSPSREYPAHVPPSFQTSKEYQYFERERGHKSHYPVSAYEPYPHDQQPLQSSRPDARVPFRRDRERSPPRDARPYDDRDARHMQKSPINLASDPRLQSSLPIAQYDDHDLDRREREYSTNLHHSSQQHPSEPRYRQSRFH